MKEKTLKYIIILLIIPIIISIILGIVQSKETNKTISDSYNSIGGSTYSYSNPNPSVSEVKKNNIFAYVSVFTLLIVAGGVWIFIKKKEEF